MGPQAKKTYSRRKDDIHFSLEKNKENIDPFDELLASPLKQDVSFKPLSYWKKKSRDHKFEKKAKHDFNNLFKSSDSDEPTPPDKRWVISSGKIFKNKVNKQDLKINSQKKKKKIISTWKITDIKNDESSFLGAPKCNKNQNLNTPNKMCYVMTRRPYTCKTLSNDIYFNEYYCDKNKELIKSYKAENDINRINNNFTLLKIECNSNIESVNEVLRNDKVLKDSFSDKNIFATSVNESSILSNDRIGNRFLENDFGKYNLDDIRKDIQSTKIYSRDILKYFKDVDCTLIDNSIGKENNVINCVGSLKKKICENQNYKFEGKSEEIVLNEKCQISNSASNTFENTVNFENVTKALTNFKDDYSTIGRDWNPSESPLIFKYCKKISDDVEVTEETLTDFNEKPDGVSNETINKTLTPSKYCFSSDNSSSSNGSYESQVNDKTVIEGTHSPSKVTNLTNLVSNLTISDGNSETKYLADEAEVNINDEIKTTVSKIEEITKNSSNCNPFENITLRRGLKKSNKYLEVRKKKSMKPPNPNVIQQCFDPSPLDYGKQECLKNDRLFPVDVTAEFRRLDELKNGSKYNVDLKNRNTLDISRLSFGLGGPVFESTRVEEGDMRRDDKEIIKEDSSVLNFSIALKPGKQWLRSLSVLRHLQNDTTLPNNSKTEIRKGRNYANFVEEVSKLQNCSNSSKVVGKSTLNCTCSNNLTLLNHTVKVTYEETIIETNSSFAQALGLMPEGGRKENSTVSAKDFILNQCEQDDILPFEEFFNEKTLQNCRKIGEGVYGEVFRCDPDVVFKIMPIEGDELVNGERQKKFEEILSEIVVAAKLSNLRFDNSNQTSCFCELKKCWCVYGKYPKILLDLWDEYNQAGEGSENDSPGMFTSHQIYVILEFENGGSSLERYEFNSAEQSYSILSQMALSLAAAEKAFEFEHRDLHWGNILVSRTKKKHVTIILDDIEYKVASKGVKVCIIDFTLSRINHEGCTVYNNLSEDPTLFMSHGDYQFEIYRMMQKEVENEWWQFKPKTNLYWLHYVIDKMLNMSRYKNTKSIIHKKFKYKLKEMESIVLNFEDSSTFVNHVDFN